MHLTTLGIVHKESYGFLMICSLAYFLEDARNMTQDKTRILVIGIWPLLEHTASPNALYTNNLENINRSSHVSKCSGWNVKCDSNVEYLRANLNIKGMSNSRRTSLSNVDYMLYPSLLRTVTDWKGKPSLRSTERSLLHDNIIPKPDLALELGKSISLTEAEEEAVAREVHATHARIVSGPDPEPMQEDQTGSNSGKLHVSLAGPNPEHMDDEFLATAYPKVHENLKLITDERVIEENPESHSGSMSSMKNLDDTYNFGDQFLYDKPTEDDQEKSKVIEESDSTIPDPSHQTVTSTPPVIAPFTDVSSTKPSSLVTPPPINTEATTITTSLPEITPFIALQLRVARLEQEMSEVKKTDHSADVLASIKSQVPTVVDKYLGTKLDDALLKILERHTADLIEKYSALPGPESIKNQESEKSPKEIIRIKREQGEEKQDSTYSIRSTDKVALEEFDLKSALFKHMNKNKTANRNPANYHLYHALMEALIADEDAMDKEVAVKVKDHKRKHDSDDEEDDDDDEGPSAGSNQGRSAKRRRPESAASGSAQPPLKDDHQSSKKPRESDASASKQHPALTSTGWQITDTRDDVVNSSMPRSDTELEHSEQFSYDIPMQDEGHFKPIPEGERPATPEPEWTIPPNDFPEPENNWANTYAIMYQVPAEKKLQRKTRIRCSCSYKKLYLLRMLYTLKQAPIAWYDELSNFLMSKGFSKAFSDVEHAECIDTRKSTSGGIQFLGENLYAKMLKKKQYCIAILSIEAQYYFDATRFNEERMSSKRQLFQTTGHSGKTNVLSAEKISVLSCYFPVRYSNHIGEEISCHLWYASVEIPGKCVVRRLIRA
ncbi:hypothetical protein Tco_0972064 [Tanacetum coccineum]